MSGTGWFSEANFVLFPELPHVGHWSVLGSLLRSLSRTPPCRALVGSRKLTSFSFQNSPMSGTGWFSEAYFVFFPELPHVGHWLVLGSLLRSLSRTPPCRALVGSWKLTSFSFQNSPMSGTGWFSEAYFVLFPELPHAGHWLVIVLYKEVL